MYTNYHPTNDFPINLEDVFKLMGFAHKKNAKRVLENNFTKDEDYKQLTPTGKQVETLLTSTGKQKKEENRGGMNKEIFMLNVETFKNMCMLVKTEEGKRIRKIRKYI